MTLTIDSSWSAAALPRNYQQGGETYCVACQTTIAKPMRDHWKSTHPNLRKLTEPFGCPNCDKKFKKPRLAFAHQHKHVNHSPIRCALCILSNRQSIEIGAYKQGSAHEAKNMTFHMGSVHGINLKDSGIDRRYLWLRTTDGGRETIIVLPRVPGVMTQARSQELVANGLPPFPLDGAAQEDSPPSAEPPDLLSPTEDLPPSNADDLSCDTDMTDQDTGKQTDNQAAAVTNGGEAVDLSTAEMDWTLMLSSGEDPAIEMRTTDACSPLEIPHFHKPHNEPLPDGTHDFLLSELFPWLDEPPTELHHNSPERSHSNADVFLLEQRLPATEDTQVFPITWGTSSSLQTMQVLSL